MKKLIYILALTTVLTGMSAQNVSDDKLLTKAKREGVSPADYKGYVAREKALLSKAGVTSYSGAYSKLFNVGGLARTANASTCGNLDFENFNYGGWSVFTGSNTNSYLPPVNVAVDQFPSTSGSNGVSSYHALVDSVNSVESLYNVSFPSNYSGKTITRINQKFVGGAGVGIIERQIAVTSNQPNINFSYAAFLENAGHSSADQPYVKILVLDSNNVAIPGASLSIVADSASINSGFVLLSSSGAPTFFYKTWTPVTINLTAYVGQTVTFQMTAASCALGGHSGHAYLDFDCGGPTAGVANVWPGDANYDLSVDYLDLFYVGAGFGLTGSARTTTGNTWAATPSNNWYTNSLYLVDAKHADCDGNGAINFLDTVAIFQNYGSGHAFKTSGLTLTAENTQSPKNISISSSLNYIFADEPFALNFKIGSVGDLVDSIYAIGFTIDYPAGFLDNSFSSLDCSNSVIENSNSVLKLFKQNNNSADVVMVKINSQNTENVQGNIFSLNLRSAPVISNSGTFDVGISNMTAITRSGSQIPLTASTRQLQFRASDATGVKGYDAGKFSIYPNPATNILKVSSATDAKIKRYEIYSIVGAVIKSESSSFTENFDVDVSNLAKGSYIIKLSLDNGTSINKRFIKG